MQRVTRHSILLVEANPSLRRMITLGLQHRGLHVIESSSLPSFSLLPSILPDLIVLDLDGGTAHSQELLARSEAHPALASLPIVALTWENNYLSATREEDVPARVYLTKPFDARTLHAAIEQLLFEVEEGRTARKQESSLAARQAAHAPSIWPLVTAIGLLIAMIGLMLQLTVTAVGLLIVITALLCWTLEPKREPGPLPV